ncbi:type II methionyl aminopeptidase [Halococcus hamelinensis]|uniref:Methionine aminopeptidase n=1 Tax=Halococcus hamelinensis 100A6 TaxID=1132509 RepID=M0LSF4_9EURY|nr:type II methionyl aminopeptidase [Halococcus hamelinensis]EMA36487.1 methionine aminopeptidase [Halococcus hamelinensis 100A6]
MSDESVDLDAEQYEKHREAGEILAQVREEAAERVEVGESHLDVAEWTEERIRELGGEPAFPVNISIDEEAAHASPSADDETTFGEEMVNLDIGVHIDGWLADTAVTVDLSGNPDLAEVPERALDAALELVEAGVETGTIGAQIEDVIEDAGFKPVVNLTGHGLARWEQHTPPNIPNRAVSQSVTLDVGDVVAVEPFATDGSGKVGEGNKVEIYGLDREGSVRNNDARAALDQITEEFRTLPFAARWLDVDRPEMALRRLERQNLVHSYPVLKEDEGNLVSQKEHTVIVTEDGCEITTQR